MVVFEGSAQVAHLEETEKYLTVVAGFLAGVERKIGEQGREQML